MQKKPQKKFLSSAQFGNWLKNKRSSIGLSLTEFAERCKISTLINGDISHSYIHKLEKGSDTAISVEKMLLLRDALEVTYDEFLENLTQKNYLRLSNHLRSMHNTSPARLSCPDQDQQWFAFQIRAQGISRKIIEPLLWDLTDREILACEIIPYSWPEDFYAGQSSVEAFAESMACLEDCYSALEGSDDRIARAACAAIEDALGLDYIKSQRLNREKYALVLQKEFAKRKKMKKKK